MACCGSNQETTLLACYDGSKVGQVVLGCTIASSASPTISMEVGT
jgi:hypothetical protein